jgi:hypothetical protein
VHEVVPIIQADPQTKSSTFRKKGFFDCGRFQEACLISVKPLLLIRAWLIQGQLGFIRPSWRRAHCAALCGDIRWLHVGS